jgi:hypothetical protein
MQCAQRVMIAQQAWHVTARCVVHSSAAAGDKNSSGTTSTSRLHCRACCVQRDMLLRRRQQQRVPTCDAWSACRAPAKICKPASDLTCASHSAACWCCCSWSASRAPDRARLAQLPARSWVIVCDRLPARGGVPVGLKPLHELCVIQRAALDELCHLTVLRRSTGSRALC